MMQCCVGTCDDSVNGGGGGDASNQMKLAAIRETYDWKCDIAV
jgi:hypothetical protein